MQFDYGGFMPNSPTSLQLPPPTEKGAASEKIMMTTFPGINTVIHGMAVMWLLSKQYSDRVSALQRLHEENVIVLNSWI